jgi:hypothetical protein
MQSEGFRYEVIKREDEYETLQSDRGSEYAREAVRRYESDNELKVIRQE